MCHTEWVGAPHTPVSGVFLSSDLWGKFSRGTVIQEHDRNALHFEVEWHYQWVWSWNSISSLSLSQSLCRFSLASIFLSRHPHFPVLPFSLAFLASSPSISISVSHSLFPFFLMPLPIIFCLSLSQWNSFFSMFPLFFRHPPMSLHLSPFPHFVSSCLDLDRAVGCLSGRS